MAKNAPVTIRLVRHGPVVPLVLGLALGLPLMAMPLSMQRAVSAADWAISLGGGALVVLFGAVVFLWPVLDRRPRLILSETGLRMPRKTGVLVPWANIEAIHHYPRRGKKAARVVIEVNGLDLPPPGRTIAPGSSGFGGVLSFWPVWLEGDWPALRSAIRSLAPGVTLVEG